MMKTTKLLLLAALVTACQHSSAPISLRVCPAVLSADADTTAAGWDTVAFAGSARAPAGIYLVDPKPLFTEWNIIAYRSAKQPDGTLAVSARLNAYAARELGAYAHNPDHLKRPLAVQIDGRWADFLPLLTDPGDHITLYGFRTEEVEKLAHYLRTK